MHRHGISSRVRGLSILAGVGLTLAATPASADIELAPIVVIDFTGFDGTGFDPAPAAGQLDSDDWSVRLSDASLLDFGGSFNGNPPGDYGRGLSMGGEDDPGIWAFDVDGAGLIALGVQPTQQSFTDGEIRLRLVNNTGADITEFQVEYTLWINNDEIRANSMVLQQSVDNMTYTDVGVATVSTEASDMNGFTGTDLVEVVTPEAAIPDAGQYYIAWHGDDTMPDNAPGNRDEFGIEGITIRLLNTCGNGLTEGEEECDNGLDNADTAECTTLCTTAVCGDGFVQDGVEECDDSNTDPGDGCAADCTVEEATDSSGADSSGSGGSGSASGSEGADTSGEASATGASATGASATGASATGASASDSDTDNGESSGGTGGEDDGGGCICSTGSAGDGPLWGVLGLLGLGLARRRRR